MMIWSRFDGFLGTHVCQYCNSIYPVDANIVRLSHFKKGTKAEGMWHYPYLHSNYTTELMAMIAKTH